MKKKINMTKVVESTNNYEYAVMCVTADNLTYYLTKNQKYSMWEKETLDFPNSISSGYTTFKNPQTALNKLNKTIFWTGLEYGDKHFLLTLNKVIEHSEKYGDYETFEVIENQPIKFELVGENYWDKYINAYV